MYAVQNTLATTAEQYNFIMGNMYETRSRAIHGFIYKMEELQHGLNDVYIITAFEELENMRQQTQVNLNAANIYIPHS